MNWLDLMRETDIGRLLINYKRILFQRINACLYDDEKAIRKIYKKRLHRELNLDAPMRFTEKLQWLKLNYRNPLMTVCVDKIAVRDYLKKKGYGDLLMPVFKTYRSVKEIHFDELPEKYILKASHGSSMHIVHAGGEKNIRHPHIKKMIMRSWLRMNIYIEGREWPYKDVPPGIICEHFVEAKTENKLKDYKFFCFAGFPEYIQVDSDLLSDHHIDFYDAGWNHLPLHCQYQNSVVGIPQPRNFERMLSIAKDLSAEFPHVRVDFYEYDNELKIGEMTFFDGSGFYTFHPDKYDYLFGKKIPLRKYPMQSEN